MNISIIEKEQAFIIKIESKQMLGYEANDFQEAILKSFEKNKMCIIVDLSSVTFIASWGIGLLMHGLTTSMNKNADFKIACASDQLLDTFKKIKVDTVLDLYNSVEDALRVI